MNALNEARLTIKSVPKTGGWAVKFTPGLSLFGEARGVVDAPLTPTKIQHLIVTKAKGDVEAAYRGRLAMSCMVKLASPGTEEMALIKELGMVTGTSTTAVRGHVTFAFSESKDGPEIISVYPTGTPAPATPSAPAAPEPTVDALAVAKAKVTKTLAGAYEDDDCIARGLGSTGIRFGGSTLADIELVATSMGCRRRYETTPTVRMWCCP